MNGATEHRTKSKNGRRNSVGGVGGVCKSAVNIHSLTCSLRSLARCFAGPFLRRGRRGRVLWGVYPPCSLSNEVPAVGGRNPPVVYRTKFPPLGGGTPL